MKNTNRPSNTGSPLTLGEGQGVGADSSGKYRSGVGNAAILFIAIIVLVELLGCGQSGPRLKQMYGSVTCGGEKVPLGQVTFVPIEGTRGSPAPAAIVNGEYRFTAPGGVPLGKHRVQVEARKKTGRKVKGFNGIETDTIDEEIRLGPEVYAGERSPLTVEVREEGDGRFDIELPPR